MDSNATTIQSLLEVNMANLARRWFSRNDNKIIPITPEVQISDADMNPNQYQPYITPSPGGSNSPYHQYVSPSPIASPFDFSETSDGIRNGCSLGNRKRALFRLIGLAMIPILILLSMNIVFVRDATSAKQTMERLKVRIQSSMEDFGILIHRLQIERGTTALYISSGSLDVLQKLRDHYKTTDKAITDVGLWNPTAASDLYQSADYFESKQTFKMHIQHYRDLVEPNITTLRYNMGFYTEAIDEIMRWFDLSDIKAETSHSIWNKLVGYQMLVMAKEQNGVQRALGSTFYALGGYANHSLYLWFITENIYGAAFLESSMFYSEFVTVEYNQAIEATIDLKDRIHEMEQEIILNLKTEPSWQKGDYWFESMTSYINILYAIQLRLGLHILNDIDTVIRSRLIDMIVSIIIMSVIFIVSPIIINAIYVQTKKIQQVSVSLKIKTKQLDGEMKRAEALLLQMLPRSVAQELKTGHRSNAEFFDEVTIFFSDIVNFTMMCAESTPLEVVAMLNALYQEMDTVIEEYDAYKVETIGDAYMVASGVPVRNGKQHAVEIAKMSLGIRHSINRLQIPHMPDQTYSIRIGLHTGPCAAGVVGRIMPRYCLFGDTVNVASRMESTGEANRIHISDATYIALKCYKNFRDAFKVSMRGTTEVKGKGAMTTYWLEGTPRPQSTTSLGV